MEKKTLTCKPNGHLVYRTNLLDHLFLFIYFIWSCAAFGLQALLPPFSNFLFYFILKYAWPKHIHKFLWLTFHIRHSKVGHCPTLLQKSHWSSIGILRFWSLGFIGKMSLQARHMKSWSCLDFGHFIPQTDFERAHCHIKRLWLLLLGFVCVCVCVCGRWWQLWDYTKSSQKKNFNILTKKNKLWVWDKKTVVNAKSKIVVRW